MEIIGRIELKALLDGPEEVRLVFALGSDAFRAARIPGSETFTSRQAIVAALSPADNIVVYSADERCPGSAYAYYVLKRAGFARVRRYAGGLADWRQAGYPLAGDAV
jgi:rhodanese-related sulfurtransferase